MINKYDMLNFYTAHAYQLVDRIVVVWLLQYDNLFAFEFLLFVVLHTQCYTMHRKPIRSKHQNIKPHNEYWFGGSTPYKEAQFTFVYTYYKLHCTIIIHLPLSGYYSAFHTCSRHTLTYSVCSVHSPHHITPVMEEADVATYVHVSTCSWESSSLEMQETVGEKGYPP